MTNDIAPVTEYGLIIKALNFYETSNIEESMKVTEVINNLVEKDPEQSYLLEKIKTLEGFSDLEKGIISRNGHNCCTILPEFGGIKVSERIIKYLGKETRILNIN